MLGSVGTQAHELTCHTLTASVVRPLGSQRPPAWDASGKDRPLATASAAGDVCPLRKQG